MTSNDIIQNAFKYRNYVYWYGGKGLKCTTSLLYALKNLYPSIYTSSYIKKCENDIKNNKYCIDCSGLICLAYGIPHIGSSQLCATFKKCKPEEAKPGMVLWRRGHVALVLDENYIIEAKGIDYDVIVSNRINSNFTYGLYLEGINYLYNYSKGWHTDEKGTWYAYGNQKGCYYKNVTLEIDGKPYTFNDEGYIL